MLLAMGSERKMRKSPCRGKCMHTFIITSYHIILCVLYIHLWESTFLHMYTLTYMHSYACTYRHVCTYMYAHREHKCTDLS